MADLLLVWRDVNNNAFDIIDENVENLSSILNIFQEPHDFLILTGSVTTYISSRNKQPKFPRKKHGQTFPDQGNAHPQNY